MTSLKHIKSSCFLHCDYGIFHFPPKFPDPPLKKLTSPSNINCFLLSSTDFFPKCLSFWDGRQGAYHVLFIYQLKKRILEVPCDAFEVREISNTFFNQKDREFIKTYLGCKSKKSTQIARIRYWGQFDFVTTM